MLLGTPDELNTLLGDHPDHDLADHPAWKAFVNQGKRALSPAPEAHYDFDRVYELAAADPDAETVSELADTVDIAARIADCCEDGMLRSLLAGTREYALLVEGETGYSGKDGAAEWIQLGDVIAQTWERALVRIESWLRWEGSSAIPVAAADDDSDVDADSGTS